MKHIIWDLDGTLIDSGNEIIETVKASLEFFGISLDQSREPLRIGPPLDRMLELSFSNEILPDDLKKKVILKFREIYDSSDFTETIPYEGIDQIIKNKKYIHHIVTNKPELATRRIVEKKGWSDYFATILSTKDLNGKLSTKKELFAKLKKDYPNGTFVCVGDMDTDAQAALENNLIPIGVLWGSGTRNEFEMVKCKKIVNNVVELKREIEDL